MTDATLSLSIFQSGYMLLLLPLSLFLIFVLLYIPAMMTADAKPIAVGQAISCYVMKALGILLMTIGFVPLLFNCLHNTLPQQMVLRSMLAVFLLGLGILVHASRVSQYIDEPSVVVIRSMFCRGFEVLGALIAISSGLILMLQFLLTENITTMVNWEMPTTFLVLGMLLMLLFSLHITEKKKVVTTVKIVKSKKK